MTDVTSSSVEPDPSDLPSDPLPDPDGEAGSAGRDDKEGLEGLKTLT